MEGRTGAGAGAEEVMGAGAGAGAGGAGREGVPKVAAWRVREPEGAEKAEEVEVEEEVMVMAGWGRLLPGALVKPAPPRLAPRPPVKLVLLPLKPLPPLKPAPKPPVDLPKPAVPKPAVAVRPRGAGAGAGGAPKVPSPPPLLRNPPATTVSREAVRGRAEGACVAMGGKGEEEGACFAMGGKAAEVEDGALVAIGGKAAEVDEGACDAMGGKAADREEGALVAMGGKAAEDEEAGVGWGGVGRAGGSLPPPPEAVPSGGEGLGSASCLPIQAGRGPSRRGGSCMSCASALALSDRLMEKSVPPAPRARSSGRSPAPSGSLVRTHTTPRPCTASDCSHVFTSPSVGTHRAHSVSHGIGAEGMVRRRDQGGTKAYRCRRLS